MPSISKNEAKKADLVKVKNERTGDVLRVISPHDLTVGIADMMESSLNVIGDSIVSGSLYVKNGASGTLVLPNGDYAIRGGVDIQVIDDGDGGFTINSLSSGGSGVALAPKNAPYITWQSSGDLSNEKVLKASGPITFDDSTATIGFNPSANLSVSSLSAASISVGGNSLSSIQFITAAPNPSFPNAKQISAGSGVSVSSSGNSITVSADSTIARLSGATFTGVVNTPSLISPSISSTNIIANSIDSTSLTADIIVSQQIAGSLTKLSTGDDYLRAGSNIILSTGSDGSVTISAQAISSAPINASYLLVNNDGASLLQNERALNIGFGLTSSDSGPGGSYSIQVNQALIPSISGASFTGPIYSPSIISTGNIAATGSISAHSITGSLTRLANGSPYLKAGQNVAISTGSDGSITINANTGSFVSGPFLLHHPDDMFENSLALNEGDGIQFHEDPIFGNFTISTKLSAGPGIDLEVKPTREIVISSISGVSLSSGSFVMVSASSDFPSARVITSSLGINVTDGGSGSYIDISIDPNKIAFLTGAHFTGDVRFDGKAKFTGEVEFGDPKFYSVAYFYAGLSGSLTNLNDGTSYLIAGQGISISTGSSGAITISNDGTVGDITEVIAGNGLVGGGTSGSISLAVDDSAIAFLTGANFIGPVQFSSGLTGSLTSLVDGSPYLTSGQNISITTSSNGSIEISSLTSFQNLKGENGVIVVLNGNEATASADHGVVAFLTGANFTGKVTFDDDIFSSGSSYFEHAYFNKSTIFYSGLSGSLTSLSDGSPYLIAGQGIEIQTGSDGSITISNNGQIGDITEVIAGNGLIGGGTSGSIELSVDATTIAFRSGTNFTGRVSFDEGISVYATSSFYSSIFNAPVMFNAGLSGSLTSLVDGTPYLIAGEGIIITTSSNGAVTISSDITASVSVSGKSRETVHVMSPTPQGIQIAFSELDFGLVDYDEDLIEVYLNGQLQHSSSKSQVEVGEADYYITGSNGVVFGFNLEGDDSIDVMIQGGDAAPISVLNDPIITFAPASSLMNSRVVTAGAGIDISTGSAGQIVISTNATGGNSSAFLSRLAINDQPFGTINGTNSSFSLYNTPSDSSRVMVWLNGQLLTQGASYDYTISGNIISFLGDSIPVDDDLISSMYPYVEPSTRYVLNERVPMAYSSGVIRGDLNAAPLDPSKIMFFWNGQLMSQGNEKDYIVIGKTIYINPGVLDYLDEDDIFIACYTAQSENVYYEINEEVTINYNSTLGLWTANLMHEPSSASKVMLFMNGQLLREGSAFDFISSGNEIVILDDDIGNDFRFYATYQYS